jgi:hypothetical protein
VDLQIGKFQLGQRLATMALRGSQFFLVGFGSSALGHSLTIQLVSCPSPVQQGGPSQLYC